MYGITEDHLSIKLRLCNWKSFDFVKKYEIRIFHFIDTLRFCTTTLRYYIKIQGNKDSGWQVWIDFFNYLIFTELPEKRILEFEKGVKVEVRFEHCNWLTNTINIVVGVLDKGTADHCNAYIYQMPNVNAFLILLLRNRNYQFRHSSKLIMLSLFRV